MQGPVLQHINGFGRYSNGVGEKAGYGRGQYVGGSHDADNVRLRLDDVTSAASRLHKRQAYLLSIMYYCHLKSVYYVRLVQENKTLPSNDLT